MLKFFPRIYKDEIAYSFFARYSVLSGNTNFVQTSEELFGKRHDNLNIFCPSNLDYFTRQLPAELGITSEEVIKRNSIFPLFKPFLSNSKAESAIKKMCNGNPKYLNNLIGVNSGGLFNKGGRVIKICPLCFKEEINKYGETYAHRLHQIPGNFVCEKHKVYLNEYPIPTNKYMFFDINNIDIEDLKIDEIKEYTKKYYLDLLNDICYILDGGYEKFDKYKIVDIYRNKLSEEGYLQNVRINQRKLMDDFISYYPLGFLKKLESDFDINNNDCWLTYIATNNRESIHPIRHILFIRFLFGSARSLVNTETEYKPFGIGPWPCLNHCADHFNELIIDDYQIKTKREGITGYFKCSCGFEYTRKGPDKSETDKYRYTSVSQRGEIWESKLKDLILDNELNLTELKKEMKCSANVILKTANKLGISNKLNVKLDNQPQETKKLDIELYKKEISDFIINNPSASRTLIKTNLTKQYMALYKYEKDWLESVLPKPYENGRAYKRGYTEEEWRELDKKLCNLINEAVTNILSDEKNHRITIKKIANMINYSGLQKPKTLDKLPNTKKLLALKCETVEQYHDRIQF